MRWPCGGHVTGGCVGHVPRRDHGCAPCSKKRLLTNLDLPPLPPPALRRYSGDGETLSTGPAVSGAPVAPAGYYASRGERHAPSQSQSPPAQRPSPPPGLAVPDTPAALARVATSSLASGLSRAVATAASALTVFTPTTNTGAPPQHLPATCFLLAHAPADDADGQAVMVTLPTRCAGHGLDFAPSLEVAHLRDGVLAFPTHDAAAAYGDELAADGADDVNIMGVDTAQLFQLALDSDACIIWFRPNASEAPPRPPELAMVLRAHGW